jgi:sec-independent protein translocase protein TatA
MFNSPVDIAMVAGVFLLLFGPKKLPELGKAIGLGIGNFKRGLLDAQEEIKTAIKEEPPVAKAPPSPVVIGTEKIPETSAAMPSSKEEEIPPPKW